MAFAVKITTLGGGFLDIAADNSWSIWDLKCAIEKESNVSRNKQNLIDAMGNELLDSSLLCDHCCDDEDALLTLIKIPPTGCEIFWQDRWKKLTPRCWQEASKVVFNEKDFKKAALNVGPNPAVVYPKTFPLFPWVAPCKNRHFAPRANIKEACIAHSVMEKASDVIRVAEKTMEMQMIDCGSEIEMQSDALHMCKARREVVLAAIQEAPSLLLPHVPLSIAVEAVKKYAGMYAHLPERFRDASLLHDALDCDPELREHFLQTASKSQINAWKWHADSKCKHKTKR